MARALLVVHRRGRVGHAACFDAHLDVLGRSLTPDNVDPPLYAISEKDGAAAVIFDPNSATSIRSGSICIGTIRAPASDWHKPGGAYPEGYHALLRSDRERVELVADAVATRTLWYVLTPDAFIAATSQRAIVALLGTFEPNPAAVAWMLSSGTLGPEAGWDRRLRRVLPDERVMLDRARWRLTTDVAPAKFDETIDGGCKELARRFSDTMESVCRRYDFDTSKWTFLLSGGVDSRGLLSLLPGRNRIQTITWGASKSRRQAWNDARVAERTASEFGVRNRFFPTDVTDSARDQLLSRFLVAGEGRIASISPFLDGFALWATLHNEGIDGVIRGDEAFGCRHVRNAFEVRHAAKLTMLEDYLDVAQIEALGLVEQTLPARLAQRDGESLATWRDRAYQHARLPSFLAGLTDLQSAYVEVVNPLLDRTILEFVRTLPDEHRTGKRMWREFVQTRISSGPAARRVAVIPLQEFLRDTDVLESMLAEMESSRENGVLSPVLRAGVCATIKSALRTPAEQRERGYSPGILALLAPDRVRSAVRRWTPIKPALSPITFAFRAFIASRMSALLREDTLMFPAERERVAGL